jgi:drug/metabolite transporter (DMT)-like permease
MHIKVHTLVIVLGSVLLSVLAQFLLRGGALELAHAGPGGPSTIGRLVSSAMTNRWLLFGFALYFAGAILWLVVLSRWEVSRAYPLVGLGFALTVVIGWVLGEAVSVQRIVGVAAICAGVWLVSQS